MQGSLLSGSGDGDSGKLQLKAYARAEVEVQGRHNGCIPVMLSITAASGTAAGKPQQRPVDLVVVLNVREKGTKRQKLLVEAVKVVAEKLDREAHDSRLGIVGGQSTLFPFTAGRSRVAGATNAVMVYYPQSSYTYTSMERALASAEKILHDRKEEEKLGRSAHMIVISDSKDDTSSLLTWRFPCVHAFGFRDEGNARTMHGIATNPGCTYSVLDDEHGCVTQALAASVERMIWSVDSEVKLKCEFDQTVVISAIDAPRINYFISYDKKVGTIFTSAHIGGGGAATNLVVYLRDDGGSVYSHGGDMSKLLTLRMEYGGHKTDGEVVTVTKGTHESRLVAAEMVRIDALMMIADIIAAVADGKKTLYAAADELRQRWKLLLLQIAYSDCGPETAGLAAEMEEMETRLHNGYLCLEYMLSWQSHQQWQLPLPPLFMDKQEKQPATTTTTTAGQKPNDEILRPGLFAALPAELLQDQERGGTGTAAIASPLEVLVRVVAPQTALAKVKRAPVDLIVVLDATDSTSRIKQQLLVKATDLVNEKLNQEDRLAIIKVQPASSKPDPAAGNRGRRPGPVRQELQVEATQQAGNYEPDAGSRATDGLTLSRAMYIPQHAHTKLQQREVHIDNVGTSIPELPHTKSKTTKLSTTLKDAVKILGDRQGGKKDRLGLVIVCSDSEDESICQEELMVSSKYTMHAFGFRGSGSGNTRAMKFIARTSNDGIYGVLNDNRDEIAEEFSACIRKIISTIAVNLTVEIDIASNTRGTTTTLSGPSWSTVNNNNKQFSLGTLLAGTARGFLVYVETTGKVFDYNNLSGLLTLSINWLNASTMIKRVAYGGHLVIVCQEDLNQMRAQLQQEGDSNNNASTTD